MVKGSGSSNTSLLNAFDSSLVEAGISGLNLVFYSSVMPLTSILQRRDIDIPYGSEVGCIVARCDGFDGDVINACIVVARLQSYYIVYEGHSKDSLKELEDKMVLQIEEAALFRGEIVEECFLVSTTKKVTKRFGCCIVAIVFDPRTYQ